MMPFVTGFLAVGTASGNTFVELADPTYARQPMVLMPTPGGGVVNGAGAAFVFANAQTNICQAAIFDSASGGNLLLWWNQYLRFQVGGTELLLYAGQLKLQIPCSAPGGTGVFAAGTALGTSQNGKPVIAGTEITVQGGVLTEGDVASTVINPGTAAAAPTGVYITGLPSAAAASDTDVVVVAQGGTLALAQPMSAIWTYIQGKIAGEGTSPPAQVTGLSASASSTSAIALTWTAPSGAATYVVQFQSGAGAWQTFETGVTGTSATVTGLAAGSAYNFRVYAVSSSGAAGAVSAVATASTASSGGTAPTTAPTVTVGSVTSASIALSWTAASGATAYIVQFRVHGTSSWTTFAGSVSGTSDTVTGLSASTEYDFQVAGTNSYGTGSYSAVVNGTTGSASVSAPGAITGLTLGTATTTTLPLTWTLPTSGGAIANITVQYRTPSGSGSYTVASASVSATATSYTITGLTAGSTYDVQVFATNSGGNGTAGQLTDVSTASGGSVPGAITAIAHGTVTSTTVPLTWTLPTSGGSITAITVQYRTPSGSGSWTTASASVSATATSYTVTGLTAGTAYDFQAFATNSSGSGTADVLTNVSTASANYTLTAVYLPQNSSYSISGNTGGTLTCSVDDQSTHGYTAPLSVRFGWSTSNTTAPSNWQVSTILDNGGEQFWTLYLTQPTSTGTYYVWAQAYNTTQPNDGNGGASANGWTGTPVAQVIGNAFTMTS